MSNTELDKNEIKAKLTDREIEVLQYVIQGKTNREIAEIFKEAGIVEKD